MQAMTYFLPPLYKAQGPQLVDNITVVTEGTVFLIITQVGSHTYTICIFPESANKNTFMFK